MRRGFSICLFGLLALLAAGLPAAAETQAHRSTHELTAQTVQTTRPRVTIYPRRTSPGRNAKRHCRSWLAQEYRVSGTVIVPKMQCWWE